MKIIKVQKGMVEFAQDEMIFALSGDRVSFWQNRQPNPSEYKKTIKQYHAIQNDLKNR